MTFHMCGGNNLPGGSVVAPASPEARANNFKICFPKLPRMTSRMTFRAGGGVAHNFLEWGLP